MSSSGASSSPYIKRSPDLEERMPQPSHPPAKRRAHRVSRACDFCHSRSIRCRQDPSNPRDKDGLPPRCQSCIEYQRPCTYNRPSKKRGVKSNAVRNSSLASPSSASWMKPDISLGIDPHADFKAPDVLDHETFINLVDIYFEAIYPIFPIFHRQTLYRRVQAQEYLTNAPSFACLVSLASLTLARVRDGGVYSERWSNYDISAMPSSETLASLVHTIIPKDTRAADSFEYMKAAGLLVHVSIQNGQTKEMHMWMGFYHTLVRITGFKNEDNWSEDIDLIETEERRRLFWAMYTLEIFSAVCFDTLVSCREAQNRVHYPREISDDRLEEMSAASKNSSPASEYSNGFAQDPSCPNWLQGWNFTTDMYRVLEHAIDRRRETDMIPQSTSATRLFRRHKNNADPSEIDKEVMASYYALPAPLKTIRSINFDQASDIFGFQAANIVATLQLVRITLFSPDVATNEQCCHLVREVIQTFAEVPIGYLKSLSTPLLYHLGSIGLFLGCMFRYPLSDSDFNRCRETLLGLSDLLANLGVGTLVGEDPARRVRAQVEKMDQYMQAQIAAPHRSARNGSTRVPNSYYQPQSQASAHLPSLGAITRKSVATPPNSVLAGVVANSPALSGDSNNAMAHLLPQSPQKQSNSNGSAVDYGPWRGGDTRDVSMNGMPPSVQPPSTTGSSSGQSLSNNLSPTVDKHGAQFSFPPEMLDDWSWAFDFGQVSPSD